jgi:hypothetical protein
MEVTVALPHVIRLLETEYITVNICAHVQYKEGIQIMFLAPIVLVAIIEYGCVHMCVCVLASSPGLLTNQKAWGRG